MMTEERLAAVLFDRTLQSPFVIGSGPLCHNGKALVELYRLGAGAVVTKTIRNKPADNPLPHIYGDMKTRSMLNAEQWSDISGEDWVESEIPRAVEAGVPVIASIGHTAEEAARWVPLTAGAGAWAVELVSYDESTMEAMIRAAAGATKKPILVKLSPSWQDPLARLPQFIAAGASGFTAMDSLGPALRIDIRTGRPVVGSGDGRGWLTGQAIRPIILHYVAALAGRTGLPVIGLGGIETAEDVVEMTMAGAHAAGLCTALMLRGPGYLKTLAGDLVKLLDSLGYKTLSEVRGKFTFSKNTPQKPSNGTKKKKLRFVFIKERCTGCGRCGTVCSYGAQHSGKDGFDCTLEDCRFCGLCVSLCPTGALGFSGRQD
jgi:dihydroorotate dehydrogenase (fumarate)